MGYDDSTFPGLTAGSLPEFFLAEEQIQISTTTDGVEDGLASVSFSYDDTAFGALPAGALRTLSTCAGELAQLVLQPFTSFANTPTGVVKGSPTFDSLSVSMTGFGTVDAANSSASNGANALVTISSELPLTACPRLLLLRPTPVDAGWPGRDDSNEAISTLWLPDEIGPVTYSFDVTAADISLYLHWQARGFNVS